MPKKRQEACRGLGTLPALIERINLTRKLIRAWTQAGKYMGNASENSAKSRKRSDLTRRLNKIFELSADFPKIVGHPGQPGYRVVAMARLEMTSQMFKMFDKDQRDRSGARLGVRLPRASMSSSLLTFPIQGLAPARSHAIVRQGRTVGAE